jgi:hypothetical protein
MRAASTEAAMLATWVMTLMLPLYKRRGRLWIKSASPPVQARTIARDFKGILGNFLTQQSCCKARRFDRGSR